MKKLILTALLCVMLTGCIGHLVAMAMTDDMTDDEIAYVSGNNINRILYHVEKEQYMSIDNCTTVMNRVYNIMRKGQFSQLQCVGVFTTKSGHAYIKYVDGFDTKLITLIPRDKRASRMKFIVIDSYRDIRKTIKKIKPDAVMLRWHKREFKYGHGASYREEVI